MVFLFRGTGKGGKGFKGWSWLGVRGGKIFNRVMGNAIVAILEMESHKNVKISDCKY